jgi:predicted nuclease of restriction endonuclease-like (RecB) superfamily
MKTLKNESANYIEQIVSAIQSCYAQNAEPTNTQLTALYSLVGKCICQQGEKAFVAHLAILLAEQLPQCGGFSMRNLRRMRDFYHTYENQPELMQKAQALGWTQNTVILDCCETDEQRSFYMELAAINKLSKLALMKAIASETFETTAEETSMQKCNECCPAVSETVAEEAVDTITVTETECGAFVTVCEPFRQGDAPPTYDEMKKTASDTMFRNSVRCQSMAYFKCTKFSLLAIQKIPELVRMAKVYLNQSKWHGRFLEPPPTGKPLPIAVLA